MELNFNQNINKYYQNFPFKEIWELFYDPKKEWAIKLENDNYDRNKYFSDFYIWKKWVLKKRQCNLQISNYFEEIEIINLNFDVDLDEYDSIRMCCKNKKACSECWKYAYWSILIMKWFFINKLGEKKFFFFFSGRRGFHCFLFSKNKNFIFLRKREKLLEILENTNILFNEEIKKEIDFIPNDFKIIFDKRVTLEPKHLIKLPFSLHTETLLPEIFLGNNKEIFINNPFEIDFTKEANLFENIILFKQTYLNKDLDDN